jgi:hypothetical protein
MSSWLKNEGKEGRRRPFVCQEGRGQEYQEPLVRISSRSFEISQSIQPKHDSSRFVRWPKYIHLQRQKAVLQKKNYGELKEYPDAPSQC